MPCPVHIPQGMCSEEKVESLMSNLRDYIGLHRLVRDESGKVIDAVLIWWNDQYESIRVTPPFVGQSMMATYYEPEGALQFVEQAFEQGVVKQIFHIGEDEVDQYRNPEVLVRIDVTWMRTGDSVVEIGSDLSDMTALELELIAQRKAYTDATRQSTLEAERSRIARDLHDSIIQNLFAISLNLKTRDDKEWAINSLHEVISEIRSTIFDIVPSEHPPLRDSIEKIVDMFATAWPTPPEVQLHLEHELPTDLLDDVENVIREGLSNAARHAKATHVKISVDVTSDLIEVEIEDDGVGPQGNQRRRGGTLSLAHRASTHGGEFSLLPGSTSGTVFRWKCPLS